MFIHDRQERIPGWDQNLIQRSHVCVEGRDWLGMFLVSGLRSLGVGRLSWIGLPVQAAEETVQWLTGTSGDAAQLNDFQFGLEYESDLDVAVDGDSNRPTLFIVTSPNSVGFLRSSLRRRNIPSIFASTANGGTIAVEDQPLPIQSAQRQDPVTAMLVAGLLVDLVRERLCPLVGGQMATGSIDFSFRQFDPPTNAPVIQVGVGGIGTYTAWALTAFGIDLHLVDSDRIEETNLNRQGLYNATDAVRGADKSSVAAEVLSKLYPQRQITAEVRRVDESWVQSVCSSSDPPPVVISACDNAHTRLHLQRLGRAGITVVQGGTDLFTAECFTQVPGSGGRTLDDQMHGALSLAAKREERLAHRGVCSVNPSYVAPSMIAGAMAACRTAQILAGSRNDFAPLRWRAGLNPVEETRKDDDYGIEALFSAAERF